MLRSRLAPFVGAGLLATALILGVHVSDAFSGSDDVQQLRKIEEAYAIITREYVERVDSAQLAADAIEGMLKGLDPHSVYVSAEEMNAVRESFNATFDGIGIYFEFVEGASGRDTLVVLMPIAGGPSEEAGLEAGDRIVEIDGTPAIGISAEQVQRSLKGPRGTQVRLQVRRPGFRQPLDFTITRDRIPLNTVIATYMIDEQTGYVRLQRFARTSAEEVRASIASLRAQGMQRLVLDLRDNAGGLLDQAFSIADEFLPAGQMIVYTDSRHARNRRQFVSTGGGAFEQGALIVLLNENSASASEIVAGALQDHDRALIVGRRSFGKGLVQQQFPLSDGSVVQMTVSRYYTPVGRLIQTPYTLGGGEEAYAAGKRALRDSLDARLAPGGGFVDAARAGQGLPDSLIFRTDGGRQVYGGGGILPDYLVPADSLSAALRTVIGRGLDNEFARVRLEQLGERFRREWTGRQDAFVRSYRLDDAAFEAFLAYAADHGVPVVNARSGASRETVLVRSEAEAARADIELRIKAFMARRLYGVDAFYPVIGQLDRTLVQAVTLWDSAQALAQASAARAPQRRR
ncbi:MAG: S41 family peptidase [Rubricoccaceae bacterium]